MKRRTQHLAIGTCVLIIGLSHAAGATLSNGFTYQGRLEDGELLADGYYDFRFQLMTDATGGTALGNTITMTAVDVSDGLFTVLLNENNEYGSTAFDGSPRWLSIAVRPSGSALGFELLSPRQQITACPYAAAAGALALPSSSVGVSNVLIGFPTGLLTIQQNGTSAAILARAPAGGAGVHAIVDGPRAAVIAQNSGTGPAVSARNSGGGAALTIESGEIRVAGAGPNTNTCVFTHQVGADGAVSVIDNPMTNGASDAFLFVTPRKFTALGYTSDPKPAAVKYNNSTDRWELHTMTEPFRQSDSYNILVIKH